MLSSLSALALLATIKHLKRPTVQELTFLQALKMENDCKSEERGICLHWTKVRTKWFSSENWGVKKVWNGFLAIAVIKSDQLSSNLLCFFLDLEQGAVRKPGISPGESSLAAGAWHLWEYWGHCHPCWRSTVQLSDFCCWDDQSLESVISQRPSTSHEASQWLASFSGLCLAAERESRWHFQDLGRSFSLLLTGREVCAAPSSWEIGPIQK